MISVLRFLERESSSPIFLKKNNACVIWIQKGEIMLIPRGNYRVPIFLDPNQVEILT